jgi:hypothetical protein
MGVCPETGDLLFQFARDVLVEPGRQKISRWTAKAIQQRMTAPLGIARCVAIRLLAFGALLVHI